MHRLSLLLLLCLALAPLGCSDGSGPLPIATTIRLGPPTLSLDDGDSTRIAPTVLDQDGEPLEGAATAALTWFSSAPAVASVTDGLVRALRPGTARITAQAGRAEAAVEVTVTPVPSEVRVTGGDGQEGEAATALVDSLVVRVLDRHGDGVPGVPVAFAVAGGGGSISPAQATTDATGAARAAWTIGAEGEQSATATVAGIAPAAFSATVAAPASGPVITAIEPATLAPGVTATLTGSGFAAAAGGNAVTIAGARASVLTASPTRLTVRVPDRAVLPCEPTRAAPVEVTVRQTAARRSHPLTVAVPRALAVGEAVEIDEAGGVRCNGLPVGDGRYLISVYNTSESLESVAAVEARTSAGSAASVGAGRAPARSARSAAPRARPTVLSALRAGAEDGHLRRLDANGRLLQRLAPRARRGDGPRLHRARAPLPEVGDTLSFRIPNAFADDICADFTPVRARAVYVGEYGVVFEDVAAPLAGRMDDLYREIGREFDRDMYPILADNFGDPLLLDGMTDDNGRFFMVFSKVVSDDAPDVAGFVSSGDFFGTADCAASNVAEIFYARVPTDPGSDYFVQDTRQAWRWTMRKTIIHEVKHITAFAAKLDNYLRTGGGSFEEAWLEESTARIAEELWGRRVYGYEREGNTTYRESVYCEVRPDWEECLDSPAVMFGTFDEVYQFGRAGGDRTPLGRVARDDWSFYGSGWSLVRWAIDQGSLGERDFLRALVSEPRLTGVANLEARAGLPFPAILGGWSVALAIDDQPGLTPASPRHDFPSWDLRDLFAGLHSDYPDGWEAGSPMLARRLAPDGTATRVPRLRGGGAVVFEVDTGAAPPRVVEVRGPDGVAAAGPVRLTIVRVR